MPQHTTLRVVWLPSGQRREQHREDAPKQLVERIGVVLKNLEESGAAELAWLDAPLVIGGVAHGECIALTVSGPAGEGRLPIATAVVAVDDVCAQELWVRMLAGEPNTPAPAEAYVAFVDEPPSVPWCAARLERGAVFYPETPAWLPDLVTCFAWAWLERPTGGSDALAAGVVQ